MAPPQPCAFRAECIVDRMFPIATDLALVKSNVNFVRFRMQSWPYYQYETHLNRFLPVRYLQFTFQAPTKVVAIGNLYVYGSITRKIERIGANTPIVGNLAVWQCAVM
jgi:hypothetical protein